MEPKNQHHLIKILNKGIFCNVINAKYLTKFVHGTLKHFLNIYTKYFLQGYEKIKVHKKLFAKCRELRLERDDSFQEESPDQYTLGMCHTYKNETSILHTRLLLPNTSACFYNKTSLFFSSKQKKTWQQWMQFIVQNVQFSDLNPYNFLVFNFFCFFLVALFNFFFSKLFAVLFLLLQMK